MKEQLLTYALSEGNLVHIAEVDNGLACNCQCPGCRQPLVAKNGLSNKKAAHFAHYQSEECVAALESAKHLLAKKILTETRELNTPAYHYDYNPENEKSRWKEPDLIFFDEVICEKPIAEFGFKPDAIGIKKKKEVYIEFAHTHFVDEEKRSKIKKTGNACIEIDLKDVPLEEEVMKTFFVSDSPLKYWIANPRRDTEYENEQKKKRLEKEERKRLKILKEQEKSALEARRLEEYRKKKDYLILHDDEVEEKCPLRKDAYIRLKNSAFYHHPVIKKIIDSNFQVWNKKIYGFDIEKGKWIFINNSKEIVYPHVAALSNLSEKERSKCRLFYAGLKAILYFLEEETFGICSQCSFSVAYLQGHEICSHSNK